MGNPNPNEKTRFKEGNKLAKVNKGKKQRKTVIKEAILKAADICRQAGVKGVTDKSIMDLVNSGLLEGLTARDKKTKITTALKVAEFLYPKKKILDAGEGFQKIVEIHRPINEIIKNGKTDNKSK
jgi:hypothetical protein